MKNFDLLRINGRGLCLSKGRIQDGGYNPDSAVVNEIIAAGKQAIPVLIEMLTDTRRKKDGESPVFCYWHATYVGDVALAVLCDLFTDDSWEKSTIPGARWDEILGRTNSDISSEQLLRDYIAKNGRKKLQQKWREWWAEYGERVEWDSERRYFRMKD